MKNAEVFPDYEVDVKLCAFSASDMADVESVQF